jgi:hypothetical protein
MKLRIARLTPDRWSDLEAIFNAKGCSIARGCWCMAYRLSGSREPLPPGVTRAQANRAALKALVDAGNPPGLIGYRRKIPVGWSRSVRVKSTPSSDARPSWKQSMSNPSGQSSASLCRPSTAARVWAQALLRGAVAYAEKHGATLIEAYPVDKPTRSNDDYMWFGAKSMYDKVGFKEIARRKPHRPIVRIKAG